MISKNLRFMTSEGRIVVTHIARLEHIYYRIAALDATGIQDRSHSDLQVSHLAKPLLAGSAIPGIMIASILDSL